jgi:addiction module HigA family antidote
MMKIPKIPPLHPGEVLAEEFLKPLEISQNKLGKDLGVPPRRINEIIQGKRGISADTALRLARYFKMSPQFWLGLQLDYELDRETDRLASKLSKQVNIYEGHRQSTALEVREKRAVYGKYPR